MATNESLCLETISNSAYFPFLLDRGGKVVEIVLTIGVGMIVVMVVVVMMMMMRGRRREISC
jgi:ABC-type lipoprotein release transport system permease subunit